jgi:hypothetical protein
MSLEHIIIFISKGEIKEIYTPNAQTLLSIVDMDNINSSRGYIFNYKVGDIELSNAEIDLLVEKKVEEVLKNKIRSDYS